MSYELKTKYKNNINDKPGRAIGNKTADRGMMLMVTMMMMMMMMVVVVVMVMVMTMMMMMMSTMRAKSWNFLWRPCIVSL